MKKYTLSVFYNTPNGLGYIKRPWLYRLWKNYWASGELTYKDPQGNLYHEGREAYIDL